MPDTHGQPTAPIRTLDEVAEVMGLSREGVRQIEQRALRKMAQRDPGLCDFLPMLADKNIRLPAMPYRPHETEDREEPDR